MINLYKAGAFSGAGLYSLPIYPQKNCVLENPNGKCCKKSSPPLSNRELERLLCAALQELCAELSIMSGELMAYLARPVSKLLPLPKRALSSSRLEGLFPSLLEFPASPALCFEEGKGMKTGNFAIFGGN